jgi:hypothetical protein
VSACLRTCAEKRQTCREGCLVALEQCGGPKCDGEARACADAARAKRVKLCPGCAQLKDCLGPFVHGALKGNQTREAAEKRGATECGRRHNPTHNPVCLKLCAPDP